LLEHQLRYTRVSIRSGSQEARGPSMAELKNMTVQALRDLARKALGRGYSRLKTKDELIAALQSAEKRVSGAVETAAAKVKEATGRAARAAGSAAKTAGKMMETAKGSAKKRADASRSPAPPAKKPAKRVARAGKRAAAAASPAPAEALERAALAQPDPEGHFVARVRGEDAVREAPHPLTEGTSTAAPPPPRKGLRPEHVYEEELGELPWAYGDDAFIALARDPKTLFLYWDHGEHTLRSAWEGLDGARPQLWIYARRVDGGWDRVRTVEFAIESRSYYVHDLDPGRIYRAEIHAVDRLGREKLVGQPSNEMELPPVGASPVVDDRFMRLAWGEPLQRLLRHVREGGPFPDELRAQFARLSDWNRFASGGGGSAGGIGGRPTSIPSSPSSPFGPFGSGGGGEGR
jgi:hypothetical protein